MNNGEIAQRLEAMASLLELDGANPFRTRAYRMAAETVREEPDPVADRVKAGDDLTELEFVGKDLANAIEELVRDGKLSAFDTLTERVPASLLELLRIPGLGPKKVQRLWNEVGVTSRDELEAALREHRVADLKGFGAKTEESLLRRIEREKQRDAEREGKSADGAPPTN